jgi:tape measure domain-containing protein
MPNEELGNLKVAVSLDSVGFQDGISKINRQLKIVQSEFEATTAALGKFGSSTDALKAKTDALTKQIELQRAKVELLQNAVAKSAAEKGEDARQTDILTIKLNKARAQLATMENELSRTTAELQKSGSGFRNASSAAEQATSAFGRLGSVVKSALVFTGVYSGINGIASAFKNAITAGIQFDAQMEQAQIGFTTMLGSAEEAKKMLEDIANFAKNTPFDMTGVEEAAKQMLAMGFSAKEILPDLKAIGDAAAALGLQTDGVQRISLALGQMLTSGVVHAEEMNQLVDNNIDAWAILAQAMGKPIPVVRNLVEQGLVPAKQATEAIIAGLEQRYPNMLQKMNSSFNSQMGNLRDSFNQTFGAVMKPMFDWLEKTALPAINTKMQVFQDTLKRTGSAKEAFKTLIPPDVVDGIVAAANGIKQLIGLMVQLRPLVFGVAAGWAAFKIGGMIAGVVSAFRSLIATLKAFIPVQLAANAAMDANPIGAIAAAIGLLVAAIAALRQAWENNWGHIQERTKAAAMAIVAIFQGMVAAIKTAFDGLRVAVLKVIQGILNLVSPAVGLIGIIAPGFKESFDRVRQEINNTTDALVADMNADAAKLSDAKAAFAAAAKGVIDVSASGKNEWAADALPMGRRIGPAPKAMGAPKVNFPQNFTNMITAGVPAAKAAATKTAQDIAQAFIDGLQSKLAPLQRTINELQAQLQFNKDTGNTKAIKQTIDDLTGAYKRQIDGLQKAMNAINAEIKKLDPKKHAADIAKLKDEYSQLKVEWWGAKDALVQLNNELKQGSVEAAQKAADAFKTATDSIMEGISAALDDELTSMRAVHQKFLDDFDEQTRMMVDDIDSQIDALRRLQEEEDRQSKRDEWAKQKEDLEHQLAVAQMMNDPRTVRQVQAQIDELNKQIARQEHDWQIQDQIDALQKQKEQLEQQRQTERTALEKRLSDLEEAKQREIAITKSKFETLQSMLEKAIAEGKLTQDQANAALLQAVKDTGDKELLLHIQAQQKNEKELNKWVQHYVDIGKKYGHSLGQGLVAGLNSMLDAVKAAASQLADAASGAIGIGKTAIASATATIQVPKFAQGGILTGPTLALAGEAGPEAVIPLNDSTMSRLASAIVAQMRGGGGQGQQVINLYLSDGTKLAEWVWDFGLNRAIERQRKG